MDPLYRFREAFQDLPAGCLAAEVNYIHKSNIQITCAAGDTVSCAASEKHMLFLRATGTATGIVYSENLEADPGELIAQALENASVVQTGQAQPMLPDTRDTHGMQAEPMSAAELREKAEAISRMPGVTECTLTSCIRSSRVLNSCGTDTQQCRPLYELTLRVPGKGENNLRECQRSAAELAAIDPADMLAQIALEDTMSHGELPFIQLPAGSYDALLSAAVVTDMMNTAWQFFAQRLTDAGRSPMRIGRRLGSPALQIVDRPACAASGYDFTIDCEGVRGPAEVKLVTDGVITDSLRTLKQGASTGCAGHADLLTANINTELISVPRNICIVPGERGPEALAASLGTGIHVTYSMDPYHSLNIASGRFSIPCGGVYYENGRPVGRLQQLSLCGSIDGLFAGLEEAGSDLTMKGMWPHYDYCFGGPSLLIRGAGFAM